MQQSNHETRGTEKTTQGARTREQQKDLFEGREKQEGVEVDTDQKPLAQAREDIEQPAGEYEISNGDRSIQRGVNDRGEHDKKRGH
ncbi:hypothetical protein SAMN05216456_3303 [Devosia crocina]|uniref:Uncharacterized protein n=1 Tax=Devosia crocina TaxID=429728 RepID=A0A1I7NUF6_9HYPH|nr:hypothetical protein [Devosia crocina]SFV38296.1 hypothetical protein SAMN05216456_3303 [Devosia crocina]